VHVAAGEVWIDLAWEAGEDLIYVDVVAKRAPTLRCAFADSGRASIPNFAQLDSGTLFVHRVHGEAFHTKGIDAGEIRFDFARVVAFSRR
jgi:hypothetical protein